MSKKNKYYVVWNGHQPGIYKTWDECLLQVKAFPNAKYKAFNSEIEARDAYLQVYESKSVPKKRINRDWRNVIPENAVVVDAACSGNPGDMEYRGVLPFEGKEIFHMGPLKKGTNNLGEFLAIVHALAYLKKLEQNSVPIYSDSKIAIKWVKLKHPATKLVFDHHNKPLQDLVKRAVDWLHTHQYSNPVLKWETEEWGENPADFGRK
ncbi:MAG: ribonuclease H family protein [Saprospiraceae bacterium]|nr:ribonuclease H family protein [Saprospiraceae bacterium]